MKNNTIVRSLVVCALCSLASVSDALATPVMSLSVDLDTKDNVTFKYDYTVVNHLYPWADSDTIAEWFLIGLGPIGPSNIAAPDGWSFAAAPGVIDWYSLGADFDIVPGTSLKGFTYRGGIPVSAGFVGVPVDAASGVATGETIGTGKNKGVPEPSQSLLLLVSVIGAGVRRQLRAPSWFFSGGRRKAAPVPAD